MQGAEPNTFQANDLVADACQQTADFPVVSLGQHNLQENAFALLTHSANTFDPEHPVGKVHPLTQLGQRFPCRIASHLDAVRPRNLVSRMRESVRQLAVIRHEQQPLAILVEPPHSE